MMAEPPPVGPSRSEWAVPAGLAAITLLVHLPVLGRYGVHHDELYFLACGRHLASGYVDHAPLVPWIARLMDTMFPGSLLALRLPAALAVAAAVFLTGLLARRLGGGRFAQLTACLAMLGAPVYLRTAQMLCIPAFELPLWVPGSYLVLRLIQQDEPKLWVWVGLVAGLGLMTKHSMLFFGFGLVAALLLTPQRRQLRSPWLYLGGGTAALVFVPNVLWQIANGWPTVEFLRGLSATTLSGISVAQFVIGQVLYLNPVTAPIWIAGLVFFFFTEVGKPSRVLGWIYVSVFVLLALINSKIYYLAPAYPALLAGGGVALEQLVLRKGWAWLRPVTVGGLAVGGAVLAPVGLPILSIGATERYIQIMTLGAFPNVYELTGDLHGQFCWKERAGIVAGVYDRLSPEERKRSVIFGTWYGVAGAVDYFGGAYGLPGAVSGHMTYHLWGLPAKPIDTLIVAGVPAARIEEWRAMFEEVSVAADAQLENVNPWERRFLVLLCRKPKLGVHELWPRARNWS